MFRGLDWGVLKVSKKLAREFGAPERAKKHVVFMQALLNKGIISQGDFQSILDIGSSEGSFLLECKSVFKHIKTYGVEPGKNFRFLTQKLFTKVFSSVEEIPEKQTFDCITMWHVLEHVSDPNKTMKEVASRMSENSLFIFEVPDETRYNGIRPIHVDHTYHYSEETLKKFLQKAGLQFVESSHEPQFLMDNIYGIKIVARKS